MGKEKKFLSPFAIVNNALAVSGNVSLCVDIRASERSVVIRFKVI